MDSEDLPSNSRSRNVRDPKEAKKEVPKVITGEVVRRKKPVGKKFRELFFGGDTKTVGQYIFLEVLIPAAKAAIDDVVKLGIERILYGESRPGRRSTNYQRPSQTGTYVGYNRFARGGAPWDREQREEPRMSRRSRATHDFDEIILATRVEAEEVIDRLFDLVSRYDQATVSDLYDLVGQPSQFTDEKWGWTDIRGAGVTRISSGYLLDLPKPQPLD